MIKETNKVKISVKHLIERVFLKGSLASSGWFSSNRMQLGIYSHKKIQKSRPEGYRKEVSLSYTYDNKGITIILSGRVDGIFSNKSPVLIEEIKSTTRNLDEIEFNHNHQHCAQAKIYAFMYAANNNLREITVQLTYVNIYNNRIKEISNTFTLIELRIFFLILSVYT